MTHLQKTKIAGGNSLANRKKKSLFWGLAQKINNPGSGKDRSRDLSKKNREKKNTLLSDQSTKRKIYSKNDKE